MSSAKCLPFYSGLRGLIHLPIHFSITVQVDSKMTCLNLNANIGILTASLLLKALKYVSLTASKGYKAVGMTAFHFRCILLMYKYSMYSIQMKLSIHSQTSMVKPWISNFISHFLMDVITYSCRTSQIPMHLIQLMAGDLGLLFEQI